MSYYYWLKEVLKIKQCRDCVYFTRFSRREKIELGLKVTEDWGYCAKHNKIVRGDYTCESEH